MAKRLVDYLSSDYVEAANRLRPKGAKHTIVAYVESYDDIYFWRTLLQTFENDRFAFRVMLPSASTLTKGKCTVLTNTLGNQLGHYMIACVDSDYDYLLQGATHTSERLNSGKFIFHTYVYAIENYQCYADALQSVVVMATLNDEEVFNLKTFMTLYAQTVFPLFVWQIWFYRQRKVGTFPMRHFCNIIKLDSINIQHPEAALQQLQQRVQKQLQRLQRDYPDERTAVDNLTVELHQLGVTPENCYLYIQGHHLFDNVVMKLLTPICTHLRRKRTEEIHRLAKHPQQYQNELTAYQHSQSAVEAILRRHDAYKNSIQYQQIVADIHRFIAEIE